MNPFVNPYRCTCDADCMNVLVVFRGQIMRGEVKKHFILKKVTFSLGFSEEKRYLCTRK